jgi:hypothetical protein
MARRADLQQPQITRDTSARESRPRRGRAEERQPQRAAAVSNQRMQKKLRAANAQQQETKDPDADAQAGEIAALLQGDAQDESGQARARMQALPEEQRAAVTAKVQDSMSTAEYGRVAPTLAQPAPNVIQPQPGKPAQAGQQETSEPKTMARANEPAQEEREQDQLVEEEAAGEKDETKDEKKDEKGASRDKRKRLRMPLVAKKKEEGDAAVTPSKDAPATEPAKEGEPKEGEAKPEAPAIEGRGTKTAEPAPAETPAPEAPVGEKPADATGKEKSGQGATSPPAAGGAPSGPAQETAGKALEKMGAPVEARSAVRSGGGGGGGAAGGGGPAPVTAGGGGGDGGGGGGGGEAAVEEAEPESAEAEATEEKMAAAEKDSDDEEPATEPEPRDEELSADKAMDAPATEPASEDEQQARAAQEEETSAGQAGGAEETAAPGDEDAENAPPAAQVELPAEERDAAMASIAEGGGGGEGGPSGGGGGGGGGGAAEETAAEEPPDVSSAPPAEAMATISTLKVGQIAGAISGVSASVSGKVSEEKSTLAAEPPSIKRPSGAPQTKDARGGEEGAAEGGAETEGLEEVAAEGEAVSAEEQLTPLEEPGPAPTDQVRTPSVSGAGEGGTMSPEDVDQLSAAIDNLPTTDPALEETAGPPPTVELVGEADPAVAEEQRTQLEEKTASLESEGAQDAAAPMGEDELYPVVPDETLTATVGGGEGGGAGASAEVDDETAAIVAEEEQGDSVRAEASAAQAEMTTAESDHETEVATKNAEHDAAVDEAVSANEEQQTARRNTAKSEVEAKRGEWTEGQRAMVDKSRTDADGAMADSEATVEREQGSADERAEQEIESGNEEARTARKNAERDASKEKEKEPEGGGFWDWVASAATAFFDGLKAAIGSIFDAARALVKGAIELAQKAAAAIIDAARDAIIAGIRLAGDVCLAAADVLLAGFPELRDQVKGAINDTVSAAEDAVNEFADDLKRGVQELLDALGKALDAALAFLEKALMAAVDAVASAVKAAIAAAKAAIEALAAFAQLIKDIAADPGGWLSKLGAAIVDGIQNHLWKELKSAVKNWFNAKLDSLLGIGTMIWDVLTKGKITFAQIGKMAFEALKAAIPMMLIQLLVEKLVAMIIPAAGAVMAIVEGLQAAWGSISAILAAIGKFIAFLKAVKSGGAGPQFAQALAAGAVAVIEFVSSFLLVKLIKPAKKVGGKVKAMAGRIMAKLKKLGQKIAKAFKKVVKKIKKGFAKLKKKLGFGKKKKKKSRTKKDKEKAADRLAKAMRVIRPGVESSVGRGAVGMLFRAKLAYWRTRFRLSRVELVGSGASARVIAQANPPDEVKVFTADGEFVRRLVYKAVDELINDPTVTTLGQNYMGQTGSSTDPVHMQAGAGYPALVNRAQAGGLKPGPDGKIHYTSPESSPAGAPKGATENNFKGATNAFVEDAGGIYQNMPKMFGQLQGTGPNRLSQTELALSLRTFASTGVLDPRLESQRGSVTAVTHLMFGREAIRNPAALAQSMMTLDLMARGKTNPQEAFASVPRKEKKFLWFNYAEAGTGGGLFPMSTGGAAKGSERLLTEFNEPDRKLPDRSKAAKEVARRESELYKRWVMAEMDRKHLIFVSKAAAESQMYKLIITRLRQMFQVPKLGNR